MFYQDSKAVLGNSLFFKTEMHFFESLPAYPSFTRNILVDFSIGCFIKKTMVNPIEVSLPRSRGNFISPWIAGSTSTDFISLFMLCLANFLPYARSCECRLCWKQVLLCFGICWLVGRGIFLQGYGRSVQAAGLPARLPHVPGELGERPQVNGAP